MGRSCVPVSLAGWARQQICRRAEIYQNLVSFATGISREFDFSRIFLRLPGKYWWKARIDFLHSGAVRAKNRYGTKCAVYKLVSRKEVILRALDCIAAFSIR
jgi:hypothetical protein